VDFELPIDVLREFIPGERAKFYGFGGSAPLWIECVVQGRDDEDWVQLDCERHEALPGKLKGKRPLLEAAVPGLFVLCPFDL
jgi:hypothetical protein